MVTPINNISAVPRLWVFHAPGRFFKLDPNQLKLYNNHEEKESAATIYTIANAAFFYPLPVCFFLHYD